MSLIKSNLIKLQSVIEKAGRGDALSPPRQGTPHI